MLILIDNGHGEDTKGKCSPDGSYREYAWVRQIALRIKSQLEAKGYEAKLIVPEMSDVPLVERGRRVNAECDRLGKDNVLLVSIHSNASGNGEWMPARGWCAYTSRGNTKADELASCLYAVAEKNFSGLKIRTDYSDGDPDWEAGFYILAKTKCPAVLTENFFHDNKEDLAYITSAAGIESVVNTHVEGIINYIKRYS